jgi:hypothetical protein
MDNGSRADNKEPTTEVVHRSDKVVERFVQFMHNAQRRVDICVDNTKAGTKRNSKGRIAKHRPYIWLKAIWYPP